jgi:hypothetical protein
MEQQPLIPEVVIEDTRDALGRRNIGNPNGGNGRPPGTRNLRNKTLERAVRSHILPVIQKVIEAALAGDLYASKLILDRVWPRPSKPATEFAFAATQSASDLRAAMHEMLGKIARGEIAPDDGALVVATMRHVLEAHRVDTQDGITVIDAQTSSARQVLADRLARALEERNRRESS